MADKTVTTKTKTASSKARKSTHKMKEAHPFETDSQIQNRYGKGRQQSGSDGNNQSNRGMNH